MEVINKSESRPSWFQSSDFILFIKHSSLVHSLFPTVGQRHCQVTVSITGQGNNQASWLWGRVVSIHISVKAFSFIFLSARDFFCLIYLGQKLQPATKICSSGVLHFTEYQALMCISPVPWD
jgi:hypothetical protein